MKRMKRIHLILPTLLISACSTPRYIPVESKTDSIYVERIVERKDTVYLDIPKESSAQVADTLSHLETSVAYSDAAIEGGRLRHSITNKDIQLKKEIIYKDKVVEVEKRVEVPVIKEVEIEKKYIPKYYKTINMLFWGLVSFFVIFIIVRLKLKL